MSLSQTSPDFITTNGDLSATKRALAAIRGLREKVKRLESQPCEPIAIVGMGCRFPGEAHNPQTYWDLLRHGRSGIREIPDGRWDVDAFFSTDPDTPGKMYSKRGGFIDHVDMFSPHFFGISPREATSMDPQQRLLLEVCWEALEHAGIALPLPGDKPGGVFIGICGCEYADGVPPDQIDLYTGTGGSPSVAAGRISYFFKLNGPSLAVDTACSSSLVALHLACQSLQHRECDFALAGGINLILSPKVSIIFSKARMLAPDGECKTFDARADGYSRGEGCGIVVLRRLSDALADNDRIMAVVRSCAINQDGASNSLTAPNGLAQERLIRTALQQAGMDGSEIGLIEAHGTGTRLGDPIEVSALANVLRQPATSQRCAIGSVKTNIGHLEAAAGIAGLIKVVLALSNEMIPPSLNFKQLNPHINLRDSHLYIPTEPTPWPRGGKPRVAGVSSFGFSGTNCYVILEEATLRERPQPLSVSPAHEVICLSAKSQSALRDQAERLSQRLHALTSWHLADVAYTLNTGRQHFRFRFAAVISEPEELFNALGQLQHGEVSSHCYGSPVRAHDVIVVIGGQWEGHATSAHKLYDTQPHYQRAIQQIDQTLIADGEPTILPFFQEPSCEWPLHDALRDFTFAYALLSLWQASGILPSAMMASGVGQWVAACAAQAVRLEDALAYLCGARDTFDWREPIYPSYTLAPSQPLTVATLTTAHRTDTASPQELELLPSTLGQAQVVLSISPAHAFNAPAADDAVWIEGISTDDPTLSVLHGAVALYLGGHAVNWAQMGGQPGRQRLDLPTYPFERYRYWRERSVSTAAPTPVGTPVEHPLLGCQIPGIAGHCELAVFEVQMDPKRLPFLLDHVIENAAVIPGVVYIEMARAAGKQVWGGRPFRVVDVNYYHLLILNEPTSRIVQTIITGSESDRSLQANIFSCLAHQDKRRWIHHAGMRLEETQPSGAPAPSLADKAV